jgi:hypothetical protein
MKVFALLLAWMGAGTVLGGDENLLARWTFANGSLKSDVGAFEFQEGNGGFVETGKSSVTLVGPKVLSCTAISSASQPELPGSVTVWARVKFDELPQSGELGVMGLQSGVASGGWPALILSLLYRSMADDPVNAGLGFLARPQGVEELGVGRDLFQQVVPGEFVNVAIVFNGAANTAAMWVSRSGVWAESRREHAALLENFDALLIGKLITPGADTAVTFDEVRVYGAALNPSGLASITAVED